MYKEDEGKFWQHLCAPYGGHWVISAEIDPQIAHKIPDLGYPLCTEKGIMYCNNRYLLLLNRFKASIDT